MSNRSRTGTIPLIVVVVCCCPLAVCVGGDAGAGPPAAVAVVGTPLSLDLSSYAELKDRADVTLSDVALEDGRLVKLSLERFEVFAPGAALVVGTPTGDVSLPRPKVALFRGHVVGDPDSRVFLSVSPYGVNGTVNMAEGTHVISSGPLGARYAAVLYNLATLPEGVIDWTEFECRSSELEVPWVAPIDEFATSGGDRSGVGPRYGECRVSQIAIESDWEFTGSLFGGDTGASAAYATTLLGATSEIYVSDLNTRLEICYLRVWSNSSDPWNQGDTTNQLYQFQDYWNANMTHISRNAAFFLSGRGLGGGVAYYPGLCAPEYDYGLAANLDGYFPYPIQHNSSQNWDLMVTAHELGHLHGGPHTHDMSPPIDECAFGDCSVVPNGTIMSYCHTCAGGLANVRMEFHQRMVDEEMMPFLDSDAGGNCDLTVSEVVIVDQPDDESVSVGESASFAVSATGYSPLSYQWRKGGADLTDGGRISGATTALLTIDPVEAGDAGNYDVVVANTCGSVTSNSALLTVAQGCPAAGGSGYYCAADVYPSNGDGSWDYADDGDCIVDMSDLGELLAHYGMTSGATREDGDVYPPGAADGAVDMSDLGELLAQYGDDCN